MVLNIRFAAFAGGVAIALNLAACGSKPPEVTTPPPAPSIAPTTAAAPIQPAVPEAAMKLGAKPKDATNCPPNAPVKGTVTKKRGNIYQTTKSPDYAQVKPDICFKDTATAEKAGFKVPQ
jgi:hypothetical protein